MTGREAHTKAAERREQLGQARIDHAETVAQLQQRQEELAAAQVRAAEFAADVSLPADTGDLAAVRDGLGAYRVALAALWPAAEVAHAAIRTAADAESELLGTAASCSWRRASGPPRSGRQPVRRRQRTRSC